MATQLTLKEVLQAAIEKEITAQQLYGDLERIITSETAKDTFRELVRQERGHQQLLERYLHGELKSGALRAEEAIDYRITENFEPTEIFPNMPLKDIFLRAANREKMAHESYLALASPIRLEKLRNYLKS